MHARILFLPLFLPSLFVLFAHPAGAESPWIAHAENVWIKQTPRPDAPAPGFFYEGSGAFDPRTGQWIHHAGHDGIPQGFHTFTCDLASGTWRQQFPPTSPPGVCCVDGANVFDAALGRFVRFPGGSLGHGFQWSRGVHLKESAVWLYDPLKNVWMNMRPPPYKQPEKYSREVIGGLCSGATYDAKHQISISFGGSGAGGAKNAMFFYDAYANSLQLIKAANPPSLRDGMGIAVDTRRDKLVVFGSQYLDDEKTYLYDFRENRWTAHDLNPRPPGKKKGTYSTIPRLAYDSINDVFLCLVWFGEGGGYETWTLDPEKLQWSKLNPVAQPSGSKSRSRNLVYSPEQNLFILELSATNNRPELWTYRYKKDNPVLEPPELTVETEADKAILSWKAQENPGKKEFHIHRAEPAEPWLAEFRQIGSTSETKFEDRNIEHGKAYSYFIRTAGGAQTSIRLRAQPPVPSAPIVSVRDVDRLEISWPGSPAKDLMGFNLYRGIVSVKTVKKGEPGAWKDNDPEYTEPQVVKVTDITDFKRLNSEVVRERSFEDKIDLSKRGPESGEYKFAVYAYILRAVNRLGVESGPSPYALTIPSEPSNFLCRENAGTAELKWDTNPEKGITGYRVYGLKGTWEIVPLTPEPVISTNFSHKAGNSSTRFWVTALDAIGQEGQPSSPAWYNHSYKGFFAGEWHQ